MRLALISDIHGNLAALEAVLTDITRRGIDRLLFLGDAATLGPQPQAVIERLQQLGCPCLMGNHDQFLIDPSSVPRYTSDPIITASIDWCRGRLSPGALDFVRGFQPVLRLSLGPGVEMLCFHATPRSNTELLLAATPPEALDEILAGEPAAVWAGGHTHVQLLRQHRGGLLINPGSVGVPFYAPMAGREPRVLPWAEYALVEVVGEDLAVEMRRVRYDLESLRRELERSDMPLREWRIQQYT